MLNKPQSTLKLFYLLLSVYLNLQTFEDYLKLTRLVDKNITTHFQKSKQNKFNIH